jgi:hypothetical protein
MTDRPQGSSGREFVYQPSDQANGAPQQHAQQSYGHYDGENGSNEQGVPEPQLPAHLHDPALRYQAYGVHQQQPVPGQFGGYGFNPAMPMGWDWTNSLDFSEFTTQYEPQGELAEELQHSVTTNDFSIPLPVTTADANFNRPGHASAVTTPNPLLAHNPLSPPPKPPQRPVIQTGMKRKAESEPDSAVSQTASNATEVQQNPPKRPNKSRQSSTTSLPSPIVVEPHETRQSPTSQTPVARAPSEPKPQANTDIIQKDRSKGTGPQGRVIDVSKPRKVVESPGNLDNMLPAGKVFPIQIGSELFRLSGASISSDGKHSPDNFWAQISRLRLLEHPHTFRISSANSYTTTAVALVT